MMYKHIFALALAGAAGTLARYGLGQAVERFSPATFPWPTLAVNASGCLLFGFVFAFFESRLHLSAELRLLVLTGFMGAFTTFSTYAFETADLARAGNWLAAAGNLAAQNLLGLALAGVGFALGRLV